MALSDNQDEVQDEIDDSELYFSPDQGNVAFGCAADGWAFRYENRGRRRVRKRGDRIGEEGRRGGGDDGMR